MRLSFLESLDIQKQIHMQICTAVLSVCGVAVSRRDFPAWPRAVKRATYQASVPLFYLTVTDLLYNTG